jgi:hypothetical protein
MDIIFNFWRFFIFLVIQKCLHDTEAIMKSIYIKYNDEGLNDNKEKL